MATAKAISLQHLASYVIRPALVEARLITQKHAADAVYMATLAEELLNVEAVITAMEQATQSDSSAAAAAAAARLGTPRGPEDWSDANWIRTRSRELDLRLHRIEQSFGQR